MNKRFILLSTLLICSGNNLLSNDIADAVEKEFTRIYNVNQWGSRESISGPGSELQFTEKIRDKISALIFLFDIKSMADAPCGDLNWMKHVNIGNCRYIGFDIVQNLIENNIKTFGPTKEFRHLNLIENVIETVDLIICRDMLAHLTFEQVFKALKNFKQSGSKYILMTTGITTEYNSDLGTKNWRAINFELAPFNFPKPLVLIEENVPFVFERGKHLGLWRLEHLNLE